MYKQINIEMGMRIRSKRKAMGFTSEQLADLLGISNQFLCDVELGKKSLSYTNMRKLCEILCGSTDYIILGKEGNGEREKIDEVLDNIDPDFLPMIESFLYSIVNIISTIKNKCIQEEGQSS